MHFQNSRLWVESSDRIADFRWVLKKTKNMGWFTKFYTCFSFFSITTRVCKFRKCKTNMKFTLTMLRADEDVNLEILHAMTKSKWNLGDARGHSTIQKLCTLEAAESLLLGHWIGQTGCNFGRAQSAGMDAKLKKRTLTQRYSVSKSQFVILTTDIPVITNDKTTAILHTTPTPAMASRAAARDRDGRWLSRALSTDAILNLKSHNFDHHDFITQNAVDEVVRGCGRICLWYMSGLGISWKSMDGLWWVFPWQGNLQGFKKQRWQGM